MTILLIHSILFIFTAISSKKIANALTYILNIENVTNQDTIYIQTCSMRGRCAGISNNGTYNIISQPVSPSLNKKQAIKECLICFTQFPNCFFYPCGHSGVCFGCAEVLVKGSKACHLCRSNITAVIKSISPIANGVELEKAIYITNEWNERFINDNNCNNTLVRVQKSLFKCCAIAK